MNQKFCEPLLYVGIVSVQYQFYQSKVSASRVAIPFYARKWDYLQNLKLMQVTDERKVYTWQNTKILWILREYISRKYQTGVFNCLNGNFMSAFRGLCWDICTALKIYSTLAETNFVTVCMSIWGLLFGSLNEIVGMEKC